MDDLNSILVEGNVVNEPEARYDEDGKLICRMTIANKRYLKDEDGDLKEEVSYLVIEAKGHLAEVCATYLRGEDEHRGIRVVGRLKQERWQDNKMKSQSKIIILAEYVEFKPKKVK
jgi:single-strand DNA-binding protein